MKHCFMSYIHRALKSAALKLKRQFCGSASNTNAVSERKGLRETSIQWIAWVYTPVATNNVVVSNGLRSTFTQSKCQIFPGGMPPDPLTRHWVLVLQTYCKWWMHEGLGTRLACAWTTASYAHRTSESHSICMPPPSPISGSIPEVHPATMQDPGSRHFL